MASRVFTVPNQLTFLRLGFLPFFIISIHYHRYGIALAILIVAGMTDGLDGILAELNPGSLIPHPRVMTALRLLCERVIPAFK